MTKKDDFIGFDVVAHKRLEISTQGAYYYLEGLAGYPNLGKGLEVVDGYSFEKGLRVVDRTKNDSYYSWWMSIKDADEFVRRVEEHRKVLGT